MPSIPEILIARIVNQRRVLLSLPICNRDRFLRVTGAKPFGVVERGFF